MSSRGKNSQPNNQPGGNNSADKSMTVVLQNIPSLPKPHNRNLPCPAPPYLGSGNGTPATDLNDQNKYYCVVTVTNLSNSSWGSNGSKTTVWNAAPSVTQMSVSVPGNSSYKVKVDYYEVKNGYWTDGIWGRGKWGSEKTFNAGYTGTVGFAQWSFTQRV